MFKFAFVALALISAVVAETSEITFEEIPQGTRSYIAKKPGFYVSHPEGPLATAFYVPPDTGGNWGDNIWKTRTSGDKLVSTEIQINSISNRDQQFNWNANFPGKSITHIRFLNLGRQRAYVQAISGNGGSQASAVINVAANYQFRLLIEVYAR